jgi:hypothetical protein
VRRTGTAPQTFSKFKDFFSFLGLSDLLSLERRDDFEPRLTTLLLFYVRSTNRAFFWTANILFREARIIFFAVKGFLF